MIFYEALAFAVVGTVLVLAFQAQWLAFSAAPKLSGPTAHVVSAVGIAAWIGLVVFPTVWYYMDATEVLRDINTVKTKMAEATTWYNSYCTCFSVDGSKLAETELNWAIRYAEDGLRYLLPSILGATLLSQCIIVGLLVASWFEEENKGRLFRMFSVTFVYALYATALIGAVVTTDVYVYISNSIENSDRNIVNMMAGEISCTGALWTAPSVPDTTTCSRTFVTEPEPGCFFGETVFVQYLLSDPTPSVARYCVNSSWPLKNSTCVGYISGSSETASPSAECQFTCMEGNISDPTSIVDVVCGLQSAVTNFLGRDEQETEFRTQLFAYGALLGTLALVMCAELINPRDTGRSVSADKTAHEKLLAKTGM